MPHPLTLQPQLEPLLPCLKLGGLSRTYLGMSTSWIYNKALGRDAGGGGFTPDEARRLADALLRLSADIHEAAARIILAAEESAAASTPASTPAPTPTPTPTPASTPAP